MTKFAYEMNQELRAVIAGLKDGSISPEIAARRTEACKQLLKQEKEFVKIAIACGEKPLKWGAEASDMDERKRTLTAV